MAKAARRSPAGRFCYFPNLSSLKTLRGCLITYVNSQAKKSEMDLYLS